MSALLALCGDDFACVVMCVVEDVIFVKHTGAAVLLAVEVKNLLMSFLIFAI